MIFSPNLKLTFLSLFFCANSFAAITLFPSDAKGIQKGSLLELLNNSSKKISRGAILSSKKATSTNSIINVSYKLRIEKGIMGTSFCLLSDKSNNKNSVLTKTDWSEPNMANSFAVGFDTQNPANNNYFDQYGNIYDRPEREVSLHWNGKEIANRLSPVEFRDGKLHNIKISLKYSVGGAFITVQLDDTKIYDRFFIPQMFPYNGSPLLAATTGETTGYASVSDFKFDVIGKVQLAAEPDHKAVIFDDEIIHGGNRTPEVSIDMPEKPFDGRIILDLKLLAPKGGCCPWDKIGQLFIFDENGEKFELQRFITPFGKEAKWLLDVSDFRPLLCGSKKFRIYIDTWMKKEESPEKQKGWRIQASLLYFKGNLPEKCTKIINLWNGNAEYGNPEKPISEFFLTRTIKADGKVKLKTTISGHGWGATTDNACEFFKSTRTVRVNNKEITNTLWTDDNYLNPLRPQGGTWKFDRAGWGPGRPVDSWTVDLTSFPVIEGHYQVDYIPMPYLNKNYKTNRAWWTTEIRAHYFSK